MTKVRVGIIGTGGMAQGHIRNLLENPDVEIAALCDNKPAALDHTVANHKGLEDTPRFTDYKEMIKKGNLDAVQIITPHTLHFDMMMDSLDAGLHVLCEKPLVCRTEDARRVLDKIDASGKVVVLSYQRHYQPEFLYIRDKIAGGEFGPVQFVQALQCQEWMKGCKGSWRHDPKWSGGGQLNDSGSHLVAVLLFVTDLPVTEVAAFIDNMGVPVDINSAISMRFENGAQGNISVVGNSPGWHEDITIWCERGVFFMRNDSLETMDATGKRHKVEPDEMPAKGYPDKNFINAILGREEVGSPAKWGLRVIELTEAAWKSAKSHEFEKVARV